jgi:hypothetical protein
LRSSTVVATAALWKSASCFALTNVATWREQAPRGYEWLVPTLDVQAERSEPRDALCFQNEFSEVLWYGLTRLYYKAFAETKPCLLVNCVSTGKEKHGKRIRCLCGH